MTVMPPSFAAAPRCVVCDAVLPRAVPGRARPADQYPCCAAIACRMVVSRRDEMGEPGFRHYLALQARHRREIAALAAARSHKKLAEEAGNAAGWLELRVRARATAAEPLQLLLPTGPRRARALSAKRYARYRAHLSRIVAEAVDLRVDATPAPGAAPSAVSSSMPGHLCALCGGGCCTKGGEQAYLSAATMRRFMDAWPRLAAEEVVAAYLERVPPAPQERSCINHTGNGCALPREMRSDICNRFHCESLARLQVALRAVEPVQVVLVVRRKQDHWRRAEPGLDNAINARALLREAGVERVAAGTRP